MTNEQRRLWCEKNQQQQVACQYCGKLWSLVSHKRHERGCVSNPNHPRKKKCLVCNGEFIAPPGAKGKKQTTCSHACSNTLYRSGENNGRYQAGKNYQTMCFLHHGKKCVICGEDKIVAAHHVNEIHTDNRPENLIPLCPTHHCYWHSGYRALIEHVVADYLKDWSYRRVG